MEIFAAWASILAGRIPALSIEITRECPLSCPGCYAYGADHLGGEVTLTEVSDFRGDRLVEGVVGLVRKHKPLHVSLVGGEPLVRHRELSRILPQLSEMGVYTLVVTSAVIPIPAEWMALPRVTIGVSIDGLPEHHDVRRKPATYERILKNIEGCRVNIHGTITRPMLERLGYLEEYVAFWSERPEVVRMWMSLYTPQRGEQSAEMLTPAQRDTAAGDLLRARARYPKLLMNAGIAEAIRVPPVTPAACMFSRMSTNYSADLSTRVEPCIFGGDPDCAQCGCAISSGLHWLKEVPLAGPLRVKHIALSSATIGSAMGKLRRNYRAHPRWSKPAELIQIAGSQPEKRTLSR